MTAGMAVETLEEALEEAPEKASGEEVAAQPRARRSPAVTAGKFSACPLRSVGPSTPTSTAAPITMLLRRLVLAVARNDRDDGS